MRLDTDGPRQGAMFMIAIAGLVVLGTLPAAQATTPEHAPAWRVETTVEALVVDGYARVNVSTHIQNPGVAPEFPFEVTVPDDAYITGLTIERDGQVHHAEIRAREAARETYDAAKAQGKTAGLVEKHRTSSTYSYLINVESFENVTATLTYERYLAADRGVYTLPLQAPVPEQGQDEGASFQVRLEHSDGLAAAWSQPSGRVSADGEALEVSYEVGPRTQHEATPLTVHYTVEETPPGGNLITSVHNGTGYFAHRLRADPDAAQLPLDMAMVLDTSGSMSGLKIQQLKDAATQVTDSLDEEDRLHLALFDSRVEASWQGLRAANETLREVARDRITGEHAGGSTFIEGALTAGFEAFGHEAREERLPVLVFLTDGHPTTGLTDSQALRQLAREENRIGAHVFTMAFGQGADWSLVHGLAQDANGTALRVPTGQGAEVDLRRFMQALTTPALKDVHVTYDGEVQALETTAPVLFAGSELLIVGTYDVNQTSLDAHVTARGPGGPASWNLSHPVGDSHHPFLPRLVAYQQIQQMQAALDAQGSNASLEENLTELALEHGFVTDQTSLVLSLPDPTQAETQTSLSTDDQAGSQASGGGASGGTGGGAGGSAATSGPATADQATSDADGPYDTADPSRHTGGSSAPGSATDPATQQELQELKQRLQQARQDAQQARQAAEDARERQDQMVEQLNNAPEQQAETPGLPVLGLLAALSTGALVMDRRRRTS